MSLRRPLVWSCAALVLGSAAGRCPGPLGPAFAVLGLVLGAGLLVGGVPRGRAPRGSPALCALAALACARAAVLEWRPAGGPPRGTPSAGKGRDPGTERRGAWALGRWQAGSGERATLEGEPLRAARGLARAGEAVLVLDPGLGVHAARGPRDAGRPARMLWARPFADDVVRLAPARRPRAPGPAARAFGALRARGLARVDGLGDEVTRNLCAAVLLGERSALDGGTVDLFTRTGARHALALSGLHVGLVAALVIGPVGAGLARVLGVVLGSLSIRARPGPELVRAALVLALVPLGGGGSPVARAAIAAALGLLAPLPALGSQRTRAAGRALRSRGAGEGALRAGFGDPGRRVDPPSLFALALGVECLAQPRGLSSVGLALSYCAAAALLAAASPAARRLRCMFPNGGRVDATWASGHARSILWTVPLARLLDAARLGLATAIVATLATLPLIWTRFGEWSPTGLVASPLVVLGLAALLCAGWGWTLLPGLMPEALPTLAARALVGLLETIDRLPGTPVPLPDRPLLLVGAGALFAILFLRSGGRRAARVAAAAFGSALLPWSAGPRGLELVVLDVGHGSAVLLRAPGAGVWLFDAGSRDRLGVARGAVAPLLRHWEARTLRVALSHLDRDHVGALPWILERWPPALWAGALPAHIEVRLAHAVPRLDLDAGRLTLQGGVSGGLEVSLLRGGPWPGNEGSRTLLAAYRGRRVLLSGDAEEEGLARMLARGDLDGPFARVLLPHHGSRTRLLGTFLERTAAEVVWTSASGAPPCADALAARGIESGWTARDGALQWRVEGPVEVR